MTFLAVCPGLDLSYNDTRMEYVDASSNQFLIQTNNVALGSDPIYSGSSGVVVPDLAGANYEYNLDVTVVFKVTLGVLVNRQILLQNGRCADQPSFMIYLDDNPSDATKIDATFILVDSSETKNVSLTITVCF